jgi:hypothetical protein
MGIAQVVHEVTDVYQSRLCPITRVLTRHWMMRLRRGQAVGNVVLKGGILKGAHNAANGGVGFNLLTASQHNSTPRTGLHHKCGHAPEERY